MKVFKCNCIVLRNSSITSKIFSVSLRDETVSKIQQVVVVAAVLMDAIHTDEVQNSGSARSLCDLGQACEYFCLNRAVSTPSAVKRQLGWVHTVVLGSPCEVPCGKNEITYNVQ